MTALFYRSSTLNLILAVTLVVMVAVLGSAYALTSLRIPSIAIAGATEQGVAGPGVLRASYVRVVAQDWLHQMYDFNPRNFAERAASVQVACGPQLASDLRKHHLQLKEMVEAGQQTHIAQIDIGEPARSPQGTWTVPFTARVATWFGSTVTQPRVITGSTTWIEGTGAVPAGARSVLQCQLLKITDERSDP